MKFAALLILSVAALVSCTTPEARRRDELMRHYNYLEKQAKQITVDAADGISEIEAYRMGKNRFDTYQTACGVVSAPMDLGDSWRVTTCTGVAGIPFEEVHIRKSDGLTTITKAKLPEIPSQRK